MKVCITTAGLGTRMDEFQTINKALLPVRDRAAISHIIDKFPGAEFVIALGHQAEQVRAFLALAHPDIAFTFVEVPNYSGEGTGPLLSLFECREHLREPFTFVASDTIWSDITDWDGENWIGFCPNTQSDSSSEQYCWVDIDHSQYGWEVTRIPASKNAISFAFTGIMHIEDYSLFWAFAEVAVLQGECEIADALKRLMKDRPVAGRRVTGWEDIGTHRRYMKVVNASRKFDFTKPGEHLYIGDDRVIKWFADEKISENRVARARLRPMVFPKVSDAVAGFYSYPFVPGQTLYQENSRPVFGSFLDFMADHVWAEKSADITREMTEFYVTKTQQRLAAFRAKYPDWVEPTHINGEEIPTLDDLLEKIDLASMAESSIPSFIHGDLQFDNIVRGGDQGFCLLDWRQDFGGRLDLGDIYYDFAKLLGGIRLNYAEIKAGRFTYRETNSEVVIDAPRAMLASEYERILWEFIRENGFGMAQTEIVLGIIYLNMAPLHAAPFDKFLHCLARWTLHEAMPL